MRTTDWQLEIVPSAHADVDTPRMRHEYTMNAQVRPPRLIEPQEISDNPATTGKKWCVAVKSRDALSPHSQILFLA
jgi:hypothetical protein